MAKTNWRISAYMEASPERAQSIADELAQVIMGYTGKSPAGKLYVTLSKIDFPPDYNMFIRDLLDSSEYLITADKIQAGEHPDA